MFFLFVHHKVFTLSHTVLIPDTYCTQVLVFAQKKRAKLRTVQPKIKNQKSMRNVGWQHIPLLATSLYVHCISDINSYGANGAVGHR